MKTINQGLGMLLVLGLSIGGVVEVAWGDLGSNGVSVAQNGGGKGQGGGSRQRKRDGSCQQTQAQGSDLTGRNWVF